MLAEYALIPDIFDSTCYSVPELCDVHLQNLKEPLLQEALVRDLRLGEWSKYVQNVANIRLRAKELLRKLINQNRLRRTNPSLSNQPSNYKEWCNEAIGSHTIEPLS